MIRATCGWHVYLQQTSGTAASALRPRIITKMCIPYKTYPESTTAATLMTVAASYLSDIDGPQPPWPHRP
jgi:hypothetical protein